MDTRDKRIVRMQARWILFACLGILALTAAPPASAQTADSKSLDEVNKELSNPISSI